MITLYGQDETQGTRALADSCLANFCFAALSRSSRQQQGTIQVLFSTGPEPSGSFFVFKVSVLNFLDSCLKEELELSQLFWLDEDLQL